MRGICVTFEAWHLGDGNYPRLQRGEKVKFSLEVYPYNQRVASDRERYFNQIADSDYSFCGQVIRIYPGIVIIDTGALKFYVEQIKDATSLVPSVGQFLLGQGRLLLDSYIWVERLDSYENPPDLFYNFVVRRIRRVKIPEKFVQRGEHSTGLPASLPHTDYDESNIVEIDDMRQGDGQYGFYLLDLEPIDEDVSLTFCS